MRSLPSVTIAAALIAAAAISPVIADVRCGPAATTRVGVAPPPPLPQTDQPPMPAYGYVWTPGSWLWNPDVNDYYWTPGAWVLPPAIGLFWTPGYWAWDDGVYLYNAGYWGPHVGFYGGVRYGYGYWGHGYDGGYWRGRTFYYNRAYNNIGALHVNALYERRVPGDRLGGRTSFNGGPGGVVAAESPDEKLAGRDKHMTSTTDQLRHSQAAAADPALRASVNHGQPRLAHAAAAGSLAAARPSATRSDAFHAQAGHAGRGQVGSAHVGMGHAPPPHAMRAPSAYRHEAGVQPRHDAFNGHYAPAYRAPAHMQSPPFHAEPPHFAPPRSGPAREGPPHGSDPGHPHH